MPNLAPATAVVAFTAALLLWSLPAAGAAPPRPDRATPPLKSKAPAHGKQRKLGRTMSCSAPLVGTWRNIDPATRSMTRADVDFDCQDVIICDTNGNCSGGDSAYYMSVFGKCHPTDCAWGRKRADDMGGGWIRSIYDFGYTANHVWLKSYSYWGLTYLRVWVHHDFAWWDGRADFTTDEWFLR